MQPSHCKMMVCQLKEILQESCCWTESMAQVLIYQVEVVLIIKQILPVGATVKPPVVTTSHK